MPLSIETIATASLIPYARNARTHTDAQIAQIAASIREFGFVNPVLVDEQRTIIAGHCRVSAARTLGLAEVPTIRVAGLTVAQRKALALADNRLALDAGWDEEMLKLELADLRDAGFDLDLTGFNAGELADLDFGIGDAAPDDSADPEPQFGRAEELRAKWGVEPGQIWRLGEHRLLCGDATNHDDVARVMDGDQSALCFTSPPYAQQRDYTAESRAGLSDWTHSCAMCSRTCP
ncbi:MAG: ParB/Srx family N-terminal domain-containing protein [bacterium]